MLEDVQIPEEEKLSPEQKELVGEMIEAGVLYGRKHSKTNPKMGKYILSTRRGVDIFDLLQTAELVDKAINFLKELREQKQVVLVVGVKPAIKDLVKNFADKFSFPYVIERWIGGTLTNFKTIQKRVERLKQLRADEKSGSLEKYTKKERLLFNREKERLELLFGGIESMDQPPAALLVVDVEEHQTAIREANRLNIPIVALINTDGDPNTVKHPIPCNDNARPSVSWVLDKIQGELMAQGVISHSERSEESKLKI
ncbi:MAG: 30S ribosomal protein S2 [Patescibacteria group bacterium]